MRLNVEFGDARSTSLVEEFSGTKPMSKRSVQKYEGMISWWLAQAPRLLSVLRIVAAFQFMQDGRTREHDFDLTYTRET
jgi:hypothetical protein